MIHKKLVEEAFEAIRAVHEDMTASLEEVKESLTNLEMECVLLRGFIQEYIDRDQSLENENENT